MTINYEKLEKDAKWDGLKGYLTNTNIPVNDVYAAYHNLWHVERAFRISKSKIEIRPMFHFTRRRIEAHVCICFVALKVYKELERLLKLSGINMSVDKVLELAKTIVTIQITLPQSKQTINQVTSNPLSSASSLTAASIRATFPFFRGLPLITNTFIKKTDSVSSDNQNTTSKYFRNACAASFSRSLAETYSFPFSLYSINRRTHDESLAAKATESERCEW